VLKLIIGNKNYSSWSVRAWLYLVESGLEFSEVSIALFRDDWQEQIARYSPAGRVPILIDHPVTIWDSLAIMEYLRRARSEQGALGWPRDRQAAAVAQSVSYEMHSGFMALRDELPQNLRMHQPLAFEGLSNSCQNQIRRIDSIWSEAYRNFDGPGLFGEFGIADIMFAPVALRLRTYGIEISAEAQRFSTMLAERPAIQQLLRLAAEEPERLEFIDQRLPAAESPLALG